MELLPTNLTEKPMTFFQKAFNSRPVKVMFAILIPLLIIGYFMYRYLKQKAQADVKDIPQPDYPNNGNGLPVGWETEGKALVDKCYNEFIKETYIFANFARREEIFVAIAIALSKDQVVWVYREFNRLHAKNKEQTLTKVIESTWTNKGDNSQRQNAINRLKQFGCV